MIKLNKNTEFLLLNYETRSGAFWIQQYFDSGGECRIKRTFHFKSEDIFRDEDEIDLTDAEMLSGSGITFILAKLTPDKVYYKIEKRILDIDFDIYMQERIDFQENYFIVDNNISVFKKLTEINKSDLFIKS